MNIEDVLRSHGVGVGSGGGGGGSGVIVTYRNTVTTASVLSAVPIGIVSFNKAKDTLFVYQGNTYRENMIDYTIASDGLSINKTSGTWAIGTTFNFVVLTSAPASEAMITASLTNIVPITANGTVTINVGVADFDANNDVLDVWHDNALYYPGDQYTLSGTGAAAAINLVGFSLNIGERIFFRIWKRVRKDLSTLQSLYVTTSLSNLVTLATNDNTTVNIGINTYAVATDFLDVHIGNTILHAGVDYTIDSSGAFITLIGFTGNIGDKFYFRIIKQVLSVLPAEPAMTALNAHSAKNASDGVHGLDATIAKFRASSSTYTDNDTSQTFADSFCTAASLVTIAITSGTVPQGIWTVTSAAGSFTITSTVAESNDITFDYYIQKVV
jgi:hypothetical protein